MPHQFPVEPYVKRLNLNPELPFSVKDASAVGDGETDDTNSIYEAARKVGATGTIFFPAGEYRVTQNLTIPCAVIFMSGASLDPDSGVTVTLSGPVETAPGQSIRAATAVGTVTVTGPLGGSGTLDVRAFGAVGDGVTDDTAAIQRTVDAAPAGATVLFPPGSYRLSSSVTRNGSSLRLLGYGATIIQATNAQTFLLRGGYDIVSVTNIAQTNYNFGSGSAIPATAITVASVPSSAAVGGYVRIASDDALPLNRPAVGATVARTGEYAMIGAIAGSVIYVPNYLQETYTTDIRLGVLADVSFEVEGLTFEAIADDTPWSAFALAMLEARAASGCRFINLTCNLAWGAFLTCVGVRGYVVSGCDIRNCENDPSANRFGYGMNDVSGDGAMIADCTFSNCRHSVTTNCDRTTAGSTAIEYYGRSVGGRVNNCQAFGNQGAGFDTHLGAYDWEFSNCRASRCEFGFNLRGVELRLVECVADRCWRGIQANNDGGASGATTQISVIECRVILATERALLNAAAVGCILNVSGGEFSTAPVTQSAVFQLAVAGTARLFGNVRFVQNSTANGAIGMLATDTASVVEIVGSVVVDMSAASGTSVRAMRFDGTNATLRGAGRLSVLRGGAAGLGYVFQGASAGLGLVQLGDIYLDVSPTTAILGNNLQAASYATSQLYGTGTPEAAVVANIGSVFRRVDGGASTSIYVKESGTGNTGWVAK